MQDAVLIVGAAVDGHGATRVTPRQDIVEAVGGLADVVAEAAAAVITALQALTDGLAVDAVVSFTQGPCAARATGTAAPIRSTGLAHTIRLTDDAVASFAFEAGAARAARSAAAVGSTALVQAVGLAGHADALNAALVDLARAARAPAPVIAALAPVALRGAAERGVVLSAALAEPSAAVLLAQAEGATRAGLTCRGGDLLFAALRLTQERCAAALEAERP